MATASFDGVSLLLSDGDGVKSLAAEVGLVPRNRPTALFMGDVDGDGLTDIATANVGGFFFNDVSEVSLLLTSIDTAVGTAPHIRIGLDPTVDMDGLPQHDSAEIPTAKFQLDGHRAAATALAFLREDGPASSESGPATNIDALSDYTQKLTLASASMDDTIRLWDPVLGDARGTLTGHTGGVRSLAFSGDGRMLASSGDDNTVRLWIAEDRPDSENSCHAD